jgi:hypothetical protein
MSFVSGLLMLLVEEAYSSIPRKSDLISLLVFIFGFNTLMFNTALSYFSLALLRLCSDRESSFINLSKSAFCERSFSIFLIAFLLLNINLPNPEISTLLVDVMAWVAD